MTDTIVTQYALDTIHVPVAEVRVNPHNIRRDLTERLDELTDSIRKHGVIQPGSGYRDDDGVIVLLSGNRRYLATLKAGLDTFPVVPRDRPERAEEIEIMLAENNQRASLDPIDEALALVELKKAGRHRSVKKIAEAVNRSVDWVAGRLKLVASLPESVWPALASGELSVSDGIAIANLEVDDDEKALIASTPHDDRAVSIRRARQVAAEAAEVAAIEAEYGDLSDQHEARRRRSDSPWGSVELGTGEHELNVLPRQHVGCSGAIAWRSWDGEVHAACVEPLQHAGDLHLLDIGAETRPIPEAVGSNDYWVALVHRKHCPHHDSVLIGGRSVEFCREPAIHETELTAEKLRALADADQAAGRSASIPDDPDRWVVHDDARRAMTARLLEQYQQLTPWALSTSTLGWGLCSGDEEVLHALVEVCVDDIVSMLNARQPRVRFEAEDLDSLPAIAWALDCCVDAGAPPPNLAELRTRIDVLTKGEMPAETEEDHDA